jgi:hypothetical protein
MATVVVTAVSMFAIVSCVLFLSFFRDEWVLKHA